MAASLLGHCRDCTIPCRKSAFSLIYYRSRCRVTHAKLTQKGRLIQCGLGVYHYDLPGCFYSLYRLYLPVGMPCWLSRELPTEASLKLTQVDLLYALCREKFALGKTGGYKCPCAAQHWSELATSAAFTLYRWR